MTRALTPDPMHAFRADFARFERELRAGRPAVPYRTDEEYEALPWAPVQSSWRPM